MFFERPVVAAEPASTASKVDPIGREHTGLDGARAVHRECSCGFVRAATTGEFPLASDDGDDNDDDTQRRVLSLSLTLCAGADVSVSALPVYSAVYTARFPSLLVLLSLVAVFVWPLLRSGEIGRPNRVTSAVPPHVVNTKHGRRTDVR